MNIQFDLKDAIFLAHTVCHNFYWEQIDRFEIHQSNADSASYSNGELLIEPEEKLVNGTMFFYESKLEAMLAYKAICEQESAMLLWDMVGEEWLVACSINFKQYMESSVH